MDLPEDIRSALVETAGVYVGRAPTLDLPKNLRRLKGFRPKALARHGDELLALFEDEAQRGLIAQALDDDLLRLSKRSERITRVALARADGWVESLIAMSEVASEAAPQPTNDLASELERERGKVKEARAEARKARNVARAEIEAHRLRTRELERELAAAGATYERERALRAAERVESEKNIEDMRRRARRLERDAAGAKSGREDARAEAKSLRKEVARLTRELDEARAAVRTPARSQKASRHLRPRPPESRAPLAVPKGLLAEARATLDLWLKEPGVSLLVDGYNVSKTEAAFGALSLEHQRTRLVDEIDRLARTRSIPVTVVFDGAIIGPGRARRARRTVEVAYSRPPETADDHLVALLDEAPNFPVVVVTDDRELQGRCMELGATIARVDQLLALIR